MNYDKTPIFNRIIEVMQDVVAAKLPLHMPSYYEEEIYVNEDTTIHNCGTAACICGYAALDPTVQELAGTVGMSLAAQPATVRTSVKEELYDNNLTDSYNAASKIFNALFGADAGFRKYAAEQAKMPVALQRSPHLIKTNPSAKDALKFLIAVRHWAYTGEVK